MNDRPAIRPETTASPISDELALFGAFQDVKRPFIAHLEPLLPTVPEVVVAVLRGLPLVGRLGVPAYRRPWCGRRLTEGARIRRQAVDALLLDSRHRTEHYPSKFPLARVECKGRRPSGRPVASFSCEHGSADDELAVDSNVRR
jgi:hypothetical protein